MRLIKKILAAIYLVAAIISLGTCVGLAVPATAPRFETLLERPVVRIVVIVAAGLTALGVLIQVLRTLFTPREVTCVRLDGDENIEVSLSALSSIARAAAQREDIMVESVRGTVQGHDKSEVRLTIEAIAFVNEGLGELAARVQRQVDAACAEMLGTVAVTTRVRFLPSKTTVVSKEVSREQG